MTDFWNNIQNAKFDNEANVELRLVIPLLNALGYDSDDIAPKYPVKFQEGTKGRRHEADFVVFYGSTHDKTTSLIVVEAKAPKKSFEDAKKQGESYAANIGTPFLLLTDGINLEIWQLQPTQESECLMRVPVKSLCTVRGKIETSLAKEAAFAYCRSLTNKNILAVSEDFRAYETAELIRTDKYQHAIDRTLSTSDKQARTFSTSELLSSFLRGAVIFAPSCLGKTTLSYSLLRHAIENRQINDTNQLPFDVPLPDFAETGLNILAFMKERINAHHAGITDANLKDLLRDKGAVLLCDGFDRLSSNDQRKIQIELKNLLRDFPTLQLFVFSRGSRRLELPLPTLELKPLTSEQQSEFLKIVPEKNNPFGHSLIHIIPKIFLDLCTVPLLLERTVEYCQREEKLPSKLTDLFRFWLNELLRTNVGNGSNGIYREAALICLAKETINTPINNVKVLKLFKEQGFPDDTFDELLLCDAIQMSGYVIELKHEALADYLRASDIVSSHDEEIITQSLSNVPLDKDSLFPVLLMALLPSRALQRILWKRLSHVEISLYLKSLRYRYDVSGEMPDLAFQYLEDLIDGLEQPLNGFFPQLQDVVKEQLTGIINSEIAITGWVNPNPAQVKFAFHPIEVIEKKILVAEPPDSYPHRWVNLELSEYRLDSGRLLGAERLKENLLEIVKNRMLKGGKIWASERLLGRLRYLEEEYNYFSLNQINPIPLDALEERLKPDADKFVLGRHFSRTPQFRIKDLIEDIAYLKKQGESSLDLWWLRLGWSKNTYPLENDVIQGLLNEHFRRLQLAYKEIVENSFGSLASEFGFYSALPVRWDLAVIREPYETLNYRWFPVASWDKAGSDVEFPDFRPERFNTSHFSEVESILKKLGRKTCSVSSGGGLMLNFNGCNNRASGRFDGETTVLYEVCELITENIERLFSELPHCD